MRGEKGDRGKKGEVKADEQEEGESGAFKGVVRRSYPCCLSFFFFSLARPSGYFLAREQARAAF